MTTVAELRAEFRAGLEFPMHDNNEEFAKWMTERINTLEDEQAKIEAAKTNPEILRVFILRFWTREMIEPFCLHMLGDYWQSLRDNAEKISSLVLTYITASGMRKTTPETAIAAMLELARDIAPDDVDRCACKLPGLDTGKPDTCPTCNKPHRL